MKTSSWLSAEDRLLKITEPFVGVYFNKSHQATISFPFESESIAVSAYFIQNIYIKMYAVLLEVRFDNS